jgi:hypothetical protein
MLKTTLKSTVAAIALLATVGTGYPTPASADSLTGSLVKGAVRVVAIAAGIIASRAVGEAVHAATTPVWYGVPLAKPSLGCQPAEEALTGLRTPDDVLRYAASHPNVVLPTMSPMGEWRDVTAMFTAINPEIDPKHTRVIRSGGSTTDLEKMVVLIFLTDRNACLAAVADLSR